MLQRIRFFLSNYHYHAEECDAIAIKMWNIYFIEYGVD